MGAGSSTNTSNKYNNINGLAKTETEIVRLMMPVYYNDEPIVEEELEAAQNSWRLILSNTSPEYLQARKTDIHFADRFPTCIMYFYNSFYDRLFDMHPLARGLFKDMRSQGRFLVKMISLAFSESSDPEKYNRTLIRLAEIHNERGVKAVEYGVVGEVLFWSIRLCVGASVYTYDVHQAWVKIYSHMLKVMVPLAVAYELKDSSAQTSRFNKLKEIKFINTLDYTENDSIKSANKSHSDELVSIDAN